MARVERSGYHLRRRIVRLAESEAAVCVKGGQGALTLRDGSPQPLEIVYIGPGKNSLLIFNNT